MRQKLKTNQIPETTGLATPGATASTAFLFLGGRAMTLDEVAFAPAPNRIKVDIGNLVLQSRSVHTGGW